MGTRFLPASKAVPKEMLPVIDKPAIQYVVEEAAASGILDVLMITGRNKRPLEDHFDRNPELEEVLQRKGDRARLAGVEAASVLADIHYVRQREALGLGHAVLCAASHVGDEPFAVLLGDDLIDPRDPLLTHMARIQHKYGGSVVALMEVPPDRTHLYGCADVRPTAAGDALRITGLVEKPAPSEAPSSYAVIGRYVLSPEIFGLLRSTEPGRGGEIQLTDALDEQASHSSGPVHGVVFTGRRYDTGDRLSYLKATVRLACERDDLGPEFRAWLGELVQPAPVGT